MRELGCWVAVLVVSLAGCGNATIGPESDLASDDGEPIQGGGHSGGSGAVTAGSATSGAVPPSLGGSAGAAAGGSKTGAGGGSNSSGGSSSSPSPEFRLLWRDEFDSFDDRRWSKAGHTFAENLGQFTADNVVVESGLLKLRVTRVARGDRPYSAAEVYTRGEYGYGRFEARIRFCKGSGIVSSLFTYKDDSSQRWEEIDIEHLGNLPRSIQFNLISSVTDNNNALHYQPFVVHLGYLPTDAFHDYAIEWKPDGISFYIDGAFSHKLLQPRIEHATRLRMNAWPTNNDVTSFAGPLDKNALPCEAQYDWVAAYAYEP